MGTHPRAPRSARLLVQLATLALATMLAACSSAPGTSPTPSGATGSSASGGEATTRPLRGGDFDQATIDEAVGVLAASGIAVFEAPDSAEPIRAVANPASPATLLLDQAEAMALEAHEGGGIEGAELDALFDVPADLAPPSYVLAGYVAAVDTAGARFARSLMGVEDWTAEDWRAAPNVVFPKLVLLLFTSDVARERAGTATGDVMTPSTDRPVAFRSMPKAAWQVAAVHGVAPPRGAGGIVPAAGGPCSAVLDFVSGALKAVFDQLRLGEQSSTAGTVLATIWNFVVTVLETVITGLVKTFEQTVLDWIGRVAAIVGTVATVISWVQPWSASVQALATTEKGVPGIVPTETGALVARIAVPANWDWPGWAADCAQASGRPLPNMKPEGTPVTWSAVIQNPPALVEPGAPETKLDAQGAARLPFTTLTDDVQDPYSLAPGAIFVHATFERQSLREFAEYLQKELWKELPSIVVGPLQAFLKDPLEKINQRLGTMVSVAASGPGIVIFHIQDETPPPVSPPPPPPGAGGGDFCTKYKAYVAWITGLGEDTDMTQPLAAEIAHRFDDMYPVAPADLKDEVALVWAIYSTFADIDEPVNIPATGQVAGIERLPEALMAMHAYCGIPWPAA